jgi:hypothetical protein
MATRSSGTPGPGGYWLWPVRMAVAAASSSAAGPSVSGKPWPRLTLPVRTASADISAKIVVPNPRIRSTSAVAAMSVTRRPYDLFAPAARAIRLL